MREFQRNAEIIEALDNVPLESAGIGHQLGDNLNLRAFQRHAARHDESDIAGTEDDNLSSRHFALDIDEALCCAGCVDAGRTVTGNIQGSSRALPASHCKDHRIRLDGEESIGLVHGGDNLLRILLPSRFPRGFPVFGADIDDDRREQAGNMTLFHLVLETLRVFGAGQFLAECVQSETVVNALIEDAAENIVPLDDEDIPGIEPAVHCARCSSEPRGAAADNHCFI